MLILFKSGPVSTTLWEPRAKALYSTRCRPSCFACRLFEKLINIAVLIYYRHRTRAKGSGETVKVKP